jgi:hypothetical protein
VVKKRIKGKLQEAENTSYIMDDQTVYSRENEG